MGRNRVWYSITALLVVMAAALWAALAMAAPDSQPQGQVLYQGPLQGTSAAGATRDTTIFTAAPHSYEEESGEDRVVPIGEIDLVELPTRLLTPVSSSAESYELDADAASGPESLQSAGLPDLITSFEGLPFARDAFNFRHIPPDPITAAGPNHLMGLVNPSFGIFTKTGTLQRRVDATVWFLNVLPGLGGSDSLLGTAFDPKVIYDHFANRWVMVWPASDFVTESWILVSVSDDADPNGTWCNWALRGDVDGSTEVENLSDYQGLGFDQQAVYVVPNQFNWGDPVSDGRFAYVKLRILPKSTLYNSSCPAITFTDFWDLEDPNFPSILVSTVRPAVTFGTPGVEYLMNDSPFEPGTHMTLWSLTNPLSASPTLTAVDVPAMTTKFPPDAEQLGGGIPLIDVGGARIRNVVYRNCSVWTAHSVADATGQFARARYVRIDVSGPTVLED